MSNALNRVAEACAKKMTKDIKSNHSKITKALPSELSALDQSLSSIATGNIFAVKAWYKKATNMTEEFLDKIQSIKCVLVPAKLSFFQKIIRLFKISLKHSIKRTEAQEKIVADKLVRLKEEQKLVKEKVAVAEKRQVELTTLVNCINTLNDLATAEVNKESHISLLEEKIEALREEIEKKEPALSNEEVIFANLQAAVMNAENHLNDILTELKAQPENEVLKKQHKDITELKEKAANECKAQAEKVEQLTKAVEADRTQLTELNEQFKGPQIEDLNKQIAEYKQTLQELGLEEQEWDVAELKIKLAKAEAEYEAAIAG